MDIKAVMKSSSRVWLMSGNEEGFSLLSKSSSSPFPVTGSAPARIVVQHYSSAKSAFLLSDKKDDIREASFVTHSSAQTVDNAPIIIMYHYRVFTSDSFREWLHDLIMG